MYLVYLNGRHSTFCLFSILSISLNLSEHAHFSPGMLQWPHKWSPCFLVAPLPSAFWDTTFSSGGSSHPFWQVPSGNPLAHNPLLSIQPPSASSVSSPTGHSPSAPRPCHTDTGGPFLSHGLYPGSFLCSTVGTFCHLGLRLAGHPHERSCSHSLLPHSVYIT